MTNEHKRIFGLAFVVLLLSFCFYKFKLPFPVANNMPHSYIRYLDDNGQEHIINLDKLNHEINAVMEKEMQKQMQLLNGIHAEIEAK